MFSNLEGFPHFEIVREAAFLFILHGVYDLEIIFIEGVCAVLVVLCYSRVLPVFPLYGFAVFFPAGGTGPVGLANVHRFFGTGAVVSVDAFFLFFWCMGFIFATKKVFK